METLALAYLASWALTAAYLGWLTLQNVRLDNRLQTLKTVSRQRKHGNNAYSKAA